MTAAGTAARCGTVSMLLAVQPFPTRRALHEPGDTQHGYLAVQRSEREWMMCYAWMELRGFEP